jgi:phage terminase Nu1 subunit (DNA packaging protein)
MLEKWSVNRMANEAGMDRRTVKKLLEKSEPVDFDAGDPVYHLRQLIDALREKESAADASLEREKTRLTKAQADQAELDLSVSRKEVVPVDIAFQTVSNMLIAVRRVIETSDLANEGKDAIYTELQNLKPSDFVSEAKFEEGEK